MCWLRVIKPWKRWSLQWIRMALYKNFHGLADIAAITVIFSFCNHPQLFVMIRFTLPIMSNADLIFLRRGEKRRVIYSSLNHDPLSAGHSISNRTQHVETGLTHTMHVYAIANMNWIGCLPSTKLVWLKPPDTDSCWLLNKSETNCPGIWSYLGQSLLHTSAALCKFAWSLKLAR